MEEKRQQSIKEMREKRAKVENAFNDFLGAVWEAEYKPSDCEFTLPSEVAFYLIGSGKISTKEFIYHSDFGDIKVTVK